MVELWFIIPAVIIFLFFLPVVMELKVSYNALTNTGVLSFYVFKINILHYIYEIKDKTISLKGMNDNKETKLDFNDPIIYFYKALIIEVKDKLRVRFLDIYYNIGLDDAFLSSMLCGYINSIILMIYSVIKRDKPTSNLGLYDTVSYNKREAVVATNLNISISLFDLVYSFIVSGILYLKIRNKTIIN
jgi:hypothetical protein